MVPVTIPANIAALTEPWVLQTWYFSYMFRPGLVLMFCVPQLVWAHGLQVTTTASSEAITGVASFADGSPIVSATVELSTIAQSSAMQFQATSRTDNNGRFAFPTPRAAGEYRVTVDDGLGHRGVVRFTIDPESSNGNAQPLAVTPVQHSHTRWHTWLSGLGYVLGLFGAAALWFARRGNRPAGN
jgi:hypothetical protein